MAVYKVKCETSFGSENRLVEARTAKSAINHVAANVFTAEVVKTPELVKLINAGNKIETLDEKPTPPQDQHQS